MAENDTLSTAVQARIDDDTLAQLTRQNDPANARTVDTTLLAVICTDAIARFELEARIEFSATNEVHIGCAVQIVVYILMQNGNQYTAAKDKWDNAVMPWLVSIREALIAEVDIGSDDDALTKISIDTSTNKYRDFDPNDQEFDGVYPVVRGESRT